MKGDIFHLINRGVEKRKIFLNEQSYLRFIYNLKDFNSTYPVIIPYLQRRKMAMRKPKLSKDLIDNLTWCLMPNHFHDLVLERIDRGAGEFSKKVTSGYTQSFNLENSRSGVLFQGRTKIIPVVKDDHFLLLPFYILSNPIKLIEPKWKEIGIKNHKKVFKFLENYRWSSYLDIIGKENFPSVINKRLFFEIYDTNEKRFKKEFLDWLSDQ